MKRQKNISAAPLLCVLVLSLFMGYACEKCSDYEEVGPTLVEMLSRPESFAAYASANSDTYDERFFDCLDEGLDRIDEELIEVLSYCDEVHADPDQEFQCQEARGASSLEFAESMLQILRLATQNPSNAEFYLAQLQFIKEEWDRQREQDLQLFGSASPAWEQLISSMSSNARDSYACEYCKGGLLRIF